MAADDINSVVDQLAKTSVAPKHELSFAGKGFKLDKEEDGELKQTVVLLNNQMITITRVV